MPRNRKNILIIDSDRTASSELQKALQKDDCAITVSEDGHELFDKQQKLPVPDLVIMEILELRPGVDTFRFIGVLKSTEKTKHTKIIVCSSSQAEADVDKAEAAGADAFIVKPFTASDIESRITSLLSGSDTADESSEDGGGKEHKTWVDFRRKVAQVNEDNRRHPRLEFHCPVRIEGLKGVHNVTDISLGGIFVEFQSTTPVKLGQVRQLIIKVPTEYDPVKVKGKVANVRKRGAGFEFVDLTAKNQQMIRFCFDTFKDTIPLR